MNSVVVDGQVLDFRYKKRLEFSYAFYIGDIYIGQIFKLGNSNWTTVSKLPDIISVDGFRSRFKASEYLLKAAGYWR